MSWYEELDQKMADYLPDVPVLREEPLSRHTSFRIGGPARRMAFPKSGEQLVLLVSFARACGARPFVLGNGTNLLFGDGETDRRGHLQYLFHFRKGQNAGIWTPESDRHNTKTDPADRAAGGIAVISLRYPTGAFGWRVGDHGKPYRTITPKHCQKLRSLIPLADIITPNITEACLLTDTPWKDGFWNAKPLSTAVEELWEEKVKILGDDEEVEE